MGRGERLNGIQEVSGSIPLISTKEKDIHFGCPFFFAIFGQKRGQTGRFSAGHPFWMSFFLCNFWTKTRSNRSFFCLLTIENVDNRQWKLSLRWSGACCGNRGCGGIRGGTSWNGYSGDASNDERLSQPAVYGHRIIGGKTFQKKSFAPNLDISLQL